MSIGEIKGRLLFLVDEMGGQVDAAMGLLEGEGGVGEKSMETGELLLGTEQQEIKDACTGVMTAADVALEALKSLKAHVATLKSYAEEVL